MLWEVIHLWKYRACIVFNFYRHLSSLVLWTGNGTGISLHNKEGVTQGETLAMIGYGIGILPLINNLKRDIPDVTQPKYADKSGDLGAFVKIETYRI